MIANRSVLTRRSLAWILVIVALGGGSVAGSQILLASGGKATADSRACMACHQGIESMGYRQGPYAAVETGPRRFVDWYMTEVVPAGPRATSAG